MKKLSFQLSLYPDYLNEKIGLDFSEHYHTKSYGAPSTWGCYRAIHLGLNCSRHFIVGSRGDEGVDVCGIYV